MGNILSTLDLPGLASALVKLGVNLTGKQYEYMKWRMSDEGKKQQTRLFSTFHTVVHGDFHLGNMLFNPDSERLKIIDNAYWGR